LSHVAQAKKRRIHVHAATGTPHLIRGSFRSASDYQTHSVGTKRVTRNERITRAAGENKWQAGSDKRSIFAKPRMDEALERAKGPELRVAHIDPATGVKDPGAGHRNSVWD